jgi:hypothetical protein
MVLFVWISCGIPYVLTPFFGKTGQKGKGEVGDESRVQSAD